MNRFFVHGHSDGPQVLERGCEKCHARLVENLATTRWECRECGACYVLRMVKAG